MERDIFLITKFRLRLLFEPLHNFTKGFSKSTLSEGNQIGAHRCYTLEKEMEDILGGSLRHRIMLLKDPKYN